jgi:hypothetical protein
LQSCGGPYILDTCLADGFIGDVAWIDSRSEREADFIYVANRQPGKSLMSACQQRNVAPMVKDLIEDLLRTKAFADRFWLVPTIGS